MTELLKRLLTFQATLGGSAIVLSATLPQRVRGELATAFAKGLGRSAPNLDAIAHPLATLVSGTSATEEPQPYRADLGRRLNVVRLASEVGRNKTWPPCASECWPPFG